MNFEKLHKYNCAKIALAAGLALGIAWQTSASSVMAEDAESAENNDPIIFSRCSEDYGCAYYFNDGVKEHSVFCHDHDLKQPAVEGTEGFFRMDYFSPEVKIDRAKKEQIASALFAGSPSDAVGLRELYSDVTDEEAIYRTQEVVWVIDRGEELAGILPTSYSYHIQYYAQNPETPRYWGATEGTLLLQGDTLIKERGGVMSTGILNFDGSYNGSAEDKAISLELPEGFTAVDPETGTPLRALAKAQNFIIQWDGESSFEDTVSVGFTYLLSKVWYYHQRVTPTVQNMVELERVPQSGTFRLTKESTSTTQVSEETTTTAVPEEPTQSEEVKKEEQKPSASTSTQVTQTTEAIPTQPVTEETSRPPRGLLSTAPSSSETKATEEEEKPSFESTTVPASETTSTRQSEKTSGTTQRESLAKTGQRLNHHAAAPLLLLPALAVIILIRRRTDSI